MFSHYILKKKDLEKNIDKIRYIDNIQRFLSIPLFATV